MNFCVLPPEITSMQMFTGAGSGPMLAAAASWEGLGSELGSAAESFSSVTTGLPWQGPASAAMAAVANKYVGFLSTAAAQAATAATQAKATAGIFEAAKAAITHPAAISANRQQLVQLVRSNLFGFNCPAIAAVEGAYESMWAKNVGALLGYHGAASAVAAQLAPWQQALTALPAAMRAPSTGVGAVMENNKQVVADVRRQNTSDLARTQALTRTKLAAAREVLAGTERTAAAASPTTRVREAARYVGDAAAINAGTGLRVGTRTAMTAPSLAGQDLDIAGGAGPLSRVRLEEAARFAAAQPLLQHGDGDLGQQITAYNQAQLADYHRLTGYQLSATQDLTHARLADAATAIGKGDVATAARRVAEAAAINVGTGLQVGTETVAAAPMMLGADLDIAGGGMELLEIERY